MNFKNNLSLWLGLAIPLLMIAFVAGSIYLPRVNAPQPQHDFLYTLNDDSSYLHQFQYIVSNGKLAKQEFDFPEDDKTPRTTAPRLYRYDVQANEQQEITFEDAQQLKLDPSHVSPDGFEVVHGNQDTGIFPFFIFAERDYSSLYLVGHRAAIKLNIPLSRNHYSSFQSLGWVIE